MVVAEIASLAQVALMTGDLAQRYHAAHLTPVGEAAGMFNQAAFRQQIYGAIALDAGVSPHHEDVTDFLLGECGAEALRELVSYSLGNYKGRGREAAIAVTEALMGLHDGKQLEWHNPASRVLMNSMATFLSSTVSQSNRRSWLGSARAYRSSVYEDQTQSTRPTRLRNLISQIPADLQDRIDRYLEQIEVGTRSFVMPTLRENRDVPTETGYVPPTLAVEDSEEQVLLPEILTSDRRLVLTGPPGAGKSTALLAHMRDFAQQSLRDGRASRSVPIRLTLRHFEERQRRQGDCSIFAFLHDEILQQYPDSLDSATLKYLLHTGQVVLLCDGLDEVLNVARRKDLATRLSTFAHAFPSVRLMLTSRPNEYEEARLQVPASVVIVCPFDIQQIEHFAQIFFRVDTERHPRVVRFIDEVQDSLDLASNPLLLGVTCALYEAGRRLPSNRAELYESCAEMLFHAWDNLRDIVTTVDHEELSQRAVNLLAYRVYQDHEEEFSDELVRDVLIEVFVAHEGRGGLAASRFARDVMDLWRGRRWLLEDLGSREGRDYYRFSHRSFLEYFAALYVVTESADFDGYWDQLRPDLVGRNRLNYVDLLLQLTRRQFPPFLANAVETLVSELSESSSIFGITDQAPTPLQSLDREEVNTYTRLLRAVTDVLRVGRVPHGTVRIASKSVLDACLLACQRLESLGGSSGKASLATRRQLYVVADFILPVLSLAEQPRGAALVVREVVPRCADTHGAEPMLILSLLLRGASRDMTVSLQQRAYARWLSACLSCAVNSTSDGNSLAFEEFERERVDLDWAEASLCSYVSAYGHKGLLQADTLWDQCVDTFISGHVTLHRLQRIMDGYMQDGVYRSVLSLVAAVWAAEQEAPVLASVATGKYDSANEEGSMIAAEIGAGILCYDLLLMGATAAVEGYYDDSPKNSIFRRVIGGAAGWSSLDALAGMEEIVGSSLADELYGVVSMMFESLHD